MIKYTKKMIEDSKKLNLSPSDLFPIFSVGDKFFIVRTITDIRQEKRDMSMICIYNKDNTLTTIPTNFKKNDTEDQKYNKTIKQIADTIVLLNENIDGTGYYIMWATDNFFEIKFALTEEIFTFGRAYSVIQTSNGEKIVSTKIQDYSYISNIMIGFGLLLFLVLYFIFFIINILK